MSDEKQNLSDDDAELVAVGHVSSAHGVRGEVVIKPYTQVAEDIAAYGPLCDETGERSFKVKVIRVTKKGVVARLSMISNRNEADALRGLVLHVPKAKLPDAEDGEWYYSDLVGLDVRLEGEDKSSPPWGAVVTVQNFGASDLLEVRKVGEEKTILVPFTEDVVPEVRSADGYVLIDPPVGLLD